MRYLSAIAHDLAGRNRPGSLPLSFFASPTENANPFLATVGGEAMVSVQQLVGASAAAAGALTGASGPAVSGVGSAAAAAVAAACNIGFDGGEPFPADCAGTGPGFGAKNSGSSVDQGSDSGSHSEGGSSGGGGSGGSGGGQGTLFGGIGGPYRCLAADRSSSSSSSSITSSGLGSSPPANNRGRLQELLRDGRCFLHNVGCCSVCGASSSGNGRCTRTLDCLHTFCYTCMETLRGRSHRAASGAVSCPICPPSRLTNFSFPASTSETFLLAPGPSRSLSMEPSSSPLTISNSLPTHKDDAKLAATNPYTSINGGGHTSSSISCLVTGGGLSSLEFCNKVGDGNIIGSNETDGTLGSNGGASPVSPVCFDCRVTTNNTVARCKECKGFLCVQCVATHQFSPQNEHHHVRSLGELLNPSPAGGDMKELLSLSTVYIAGNSKLHDLSSAMKSVKLNAARLKEKAYRIRTDVDETATFFHECVESRKRDLHDQLDKEVEERTCYLTDYGRGMENLHKGINQVNRYIEEQLRRSNNEAVKRRRELIEIKMTELVDARDASVSLERSAAAAADLEFTADRLAVRKGVLEGFGDLRRSGNVVDDDAHNLSGGSDKKGLQLLAEATKCPSVETAERSSSTSASSSSDASSTEGSGDSGSGSGPGCGGCYGASTVASAALPPSRSENGGSSSENPADLNLSSTFGSSSVVCGRRRFPGLAPSLAPAVSGGGVIDRSDSCGSDSGGHGGFLGCRRQGEPDRGWSSESGPDGRSGSNGAPFPNRCSFGNPNGTGSSAAAVGIGGNVGGNGGGPDVMFVRLGETKGGSNHIFSGESAMVAAFAACTAAGSGPGHHGEDGLGGASNSCWHQFYPGHRGAAGYSVDDGADNDDGKGSAAVNAIGNRSSAAAESGQSSISPDHLLEVTRRLSHLPYQHPQPALASSSAATATHHRYNVYGGHNHHHHHMQVNNDMNRSCAGNGYLRGGGLIGNPYQPVSTAAATQPQQTACLQRTGSAGGVGNGNLLFARSGGCCRRSKMIYGCKFGEFGVMEGQFTEPSGVAVNAKNDIIVADTNNHRIQIFGKDGRFKFQFGECGKHDGQLLYPNRVAVNRATGDIVVTERSPTHQVQIYDQRGEFKRKFGANVLQHPRGVCVDDGGRIVVVECKVMRVIIFDEMGNVINKFGCSKHLEFPNGVAVNASKEIFISDNRAHCVKVFSYSGSFLRVIGGEGLTNYPIGVGINLEGHVVVADNHNNFNLTVFDQDGRLLSALESRVKHAQCFDVALLDSDSAVLASKDYRLYVYRYGSISSSNLFTPQSTVHF